MLKSCDRLLPSPSVPDLEETVSKYLKSVKNILAKDEYALVEEQAQSFLQNEGRKLHTYSWLMSLMSDNYITPFWEKYAYLYSREPVLVNSSVAHTDLMEVPEDRRATRAYMAARVTFFESMSQLAIDRQDLKPLGAGLLCACHYEKLYSVCRIPGEQVDRLVNYGISKHVVAILDGCFYKISLCNEKNQVYTIDQLAKIYAELLSRNEAVQGAEAMVAALTTDRRDEWARNREKFFLKHPINAATLREIESAAFILILDDEEYRKDNNSVNELSYFLRRMLTGNGVNRWADKSLNYSVGRNARCGGTTEHSIGDGSEFDHIMENYVVNELLTKYPPLEEQHQIQQMTESDQGLVLAERLPVEVSDEMGVAIQRCYDQYEKLREDVDLAASIFRDFGKGFIKKCGISPDGFVQMAIQLANYRVRILS
ncbi:Choline/Carnitine O-acyltransferase [Oesophagostomum dentatum]|uniref:Choline/Carnitine O-acyltransferase n=1 Tax=Oesophagostomum dentatum TaxID=61180 RepID=A0A0B1SNH7_OESDE|nr:Choline/Carnitine O-acyltransferase [Oesophagostomum dentatum]